MSRFESHTGPLQTARGVIIIGLAITGVGFVGVGGWAATSSLASGSIASGVVAVSSSRQTVQHLEGGIIAKIHVREGEQIDAGDILVTLDDTRPQSAYALFKGQYLSAIGERDRLMAERDGLQNVVFSVELDGDKNSVVRQGQTNVFNSRRTYMMGQRAITDERKDQLRNEIVALQSQAKSEAEQIVLVKDEMVGVESLLKRGFATKPKLLTLQREAARIEGKQGELSARIAKAEQQISELDVQFIDLENARMSEIVEDLRLVEEKISDLLPRLNSAADTLERTEILAPRSGFIVDMHVTTQGGIIPPGQAILDIVPSSDSMVVEAKFKPQDIDVLHTGMEASVTLSAYSRRRVPPVEGKLVVLSADTVVDQVTGQSFYSGRIEVDADELAKLDGVRLIPGMPAEVMIHTGERTVLDYILDPLRQSMSRAMRE